MSELAEITGQLQHLADRSDRLRATLGQLRSGTVAAAIASAAAEARRPGPDGAKAKRRLSVLHTVEKELRNGEAALAHGHSAAATWLARHAATGRGGSRHAGAEPHRRRQGAASGRPGSDRRPATQQANHGHGPGAAHSDFFHGGKHVGAKVAAGATAFVLGFATGSPSLSIASLAREVPADVAGDFVTDLIADGLPVHPPSLHLARSAGHGPKHYEIGKAAAVIGGQLTAFGASFVLLHLGAVAGFALLRAYPPAVRIGAGVGSTLGFVVSEYAKHREEALR